MTKSLRAVCTGLVLCACTVSSARAFGPETSASARSFRPDPATVERYGRGCRYPQAGWIVLHIEGEPYERGYQHGRLLAPEIADNLAVAKLSLTHDGKRDWAFYRKAAETVFWPRVDDEYRQEMQGIAAGAAAGGTAVDLWDVVALNASIEVGYYTAVLDHGESVSTFCASCNVHSV